MANRLLTIDEVGKLLMDSFSRLTPAEQHAELYSMQVGMNGFPRDRAEEERIVAALEAEKSAGLHG